MRNLIYFQMTRDAKIITAPCHFTARMFFLPFKEQQKFLVGSGVSIRRIGKAGKVLESKKKRPFVLISKISRLDISIICVRIANLCCYANRVR